LRVALDRSADHETIRSRQGRHRYRKIQITNVLHFICETAALQVTLRTGRTLAAHAQRLPHHWLCGDRRVGGLGGEFADQAIGVGGAPAGCLRSATG